MPRPFKIDLALQGGGSHGAFTWGVLDALLQDETLGFAGVCGTSAGALNAAVMATGLAAGGAAGARRALAAFWADVGASSACFGLDPFDTAQKLQDNPMFGWFSAAMRSVSPYQFNPLGINPLREVLKRHVDEAALRKGPLKLFVNATSVVTGQPRIFSGASLGLDALLASACLPQLFQAVQIDGVPYWDGGYSGNPALWPLIYETAAVDLLLVRINPLQRAGTPTTAMEILDRVNEITFNAGLVGEMRAIAFVSRLLKEQRLDGNRYKDLRLHMIGDDAALADFPSSTKLNTDPRLLQQLFQRGQQVANDWLKQHRDDIGERSTLDIEQTFLSPRDLGLR
ncbi:patatin-like phospholipase family protein [Aquabacterium sp.]|uniref:patatin-like phospholipase family protein n=1 Tax=Aquabacterium sp. TaxID=1872578 RepID=UPI0037849F84